MSVRLRPYICPAYQTTGINEEAIEGNGEGKIRIGKGLVESSLSGFNTSYNNQFCLSPENMNTNYVLTVQYRIPKEERLDKFIEAIQPFSNRIIIRQEGSKRTIESRREKRIEIILNHLSNKPRKLKEVYTLAKRRIRIGGWRNFRRDIAFMGCVGQIHVEIRRNKPKGVTTYVWLKKGSTGHGPVNVRYIKTKDIKS